MVVNKLPNDLNQDSEYVIPLINNYTNTENVTVGWGLTDDDDTADTVG
mgnify:CR=1 FL=1